MSKVGLFILCVVSQTENSGSLKFIAWTFDIIHVSRNAHQSKSQMITNIFMNSSQNSKKTLTHTEIRIVT